MSEPELSEADEPAVGAGFVTEEAVYGLILVAGMILVTSRHGESSWSVFLTVAATVVVFYLAHVYAGTIAHLGLRRKGEPMHLGPAVREAARRSSGLLVGAVVPCAILLLGASDLVPDDGALSFALWSEVLMLALLGYVAFARRGATMLNRVLGALATASFGVVMVILKALVH